MTSLLDLTDTLLTLREQQNLQRLLQHHDNFSEASQLLDAALASGTPTYLPLVVVYLICTQRPGRWHQFQQCRQFWAAWRCLPEEAKCGRAPLPAQQLVSMTLRLVNTSYASLLDLLHPNSTTPAIINPSDSHTTSHQSLARLIESFSLPVSGAQDKPVVAIALPNGALLARILLATATFYTASPMQHGVGVGAEQLKRDILQSGSKFVLALASDIERLQLRAPWFSQAGVDVFLVDIIDNTITLHDVDGRQVDQRAWPRPVPNRAGDIAVLLFTSGTSGTKKLVPLHLETLITGVAMVQESWCLTSTSCCLNQMPLNHVGGIVRNLFAPILTGGSVICCAAFDAHAFWDVIDQYRPTWYYASPTMHQCILDAALERPESVLRSHIKLICNAAGGLLPSLASQLRETFSRSNLQCTVLPSYGMTECMPISTPPLDYKLDRIGTSGKSVGPEIAILDKDDLRMCTNTVGRIAVRGAPVFAGYLKDGMLDRSCFTSEGWFDTGDMGYLDAEGYLYITGRSKEVINRGGELISPFEIEEAVLAAAKDSNSPIFGRISKALAFAVPHDVLQEVVGLVVTTPENRKRPCLKTIQEGTRNSLASVKIPILLVFMNDDLPTNNNKVLRIRLAERLSIPTLSDDTPADQRYYEAICPPKNSPLTTAIRSRLLPPSTGSLTSACKLLLPASTDFYIGTANHTHPILYLAPVRPDPVFTSVWNHAAVLSLKHALTQLDSYRSPGRIHILASPLPRNADGTVAEACLVQPDISTKQLTNSTQGSVIAAFAEVLSLPPEAVHEESDFFKLGGDSMKAGRLLSILRRELTARITIDVLFNNSTVAALTAIAESVSPVTTGTSLKKPLPGCTKTCSSTNPFLLLIQLIPIILIAPMRRALTWTFFIYSLTYSSTLPTTDCLPGRFLNLVVSLFIGKTISEVCAPLLAIALKWLIIGRYRQGLYPMWSVYHTRWWLVQKILCIGGYGIYGHFNYTRVLYYRCLGAKIGRNCIIDEHARLGEYDLISISDDVVLDACTIRPFAVERNTSMYLGPISIGKGASVGQASYIAAGSTIPADACIGANSSSWELQDACEANRFLSPSKIIKPHWLLELLFIHPIIIVAYFVGAIPWMGGLMPLVITEPKKNASDIFREVVLWFSSPQRVVFHYVALGARAALGPIFFFLAVFAIKTILDACGGGPVRAGSAKTQSQFDRFRMSLLRALMPDRNFHNLTNLFGTHYAATSVFARLLGARVGKRVYWPGKGPRIQDYDMLDIGDNVVFGSRSSIITSDGLGTKHVKIGSNSMVADRVVLRPGIELGQRTVMGSGALTQRNKHYPAGTTWVGSKSNDAVCLTSGAETSSRHQRYRLSLDVQSIWNEKKHGKIVHVLETMLDSRNSSMSEHKSIDEPELQHTLTHDNAEASSPFGRAFYEGLAPYRVWGQFSIALYSTFLTIFTAVFWNIHSIGAIQVVAWIYRQPEYTNGFLRDREVRPLFIYAFFTALIACIMATQIVIALAIIIAFKWALLGRRKAGNYDWDKSPYCQRWQLLLKIESLRQKCYGGHGILGLLTGTHWIVLYFRALGAIVGKDCALFASGTPSLYFTEPDLLTLGDRVSVDDASLVCHINTRGKFDLNPLYVGDRSVLRSGSRLLSGARMEADSCLLEHTLVMAGDVVDAGATIQGWPGDEFEGDRLATTTNG